MEPFTFFVSYRRQDTAPIALLIKNEIEKRLQFVRVYVDVEDIQSGDVFPDRIKNLIRESHATIALIGKSWMPRRGASPMESRKKGKKDWVVSELELSSSLAIEHSKRNRYGRMKRFVLPLFADCDRRFDQFEIPKAIHYLKALQSEHITYANWPAAIGPLVDRIAVALKLKKRPDADKYPTPSPTKARTQPLEDQALTSTLSYSDYAGWYVDNFGNTEVRYLVKTFRFPHFNQAADFMKMVSDHCRVLDHHPEWRNVFNHVTVSLTTWDARRRVTIYDLNLALFMNKAAASVGAT